MATTGCTSPGSITLASMRKLHALHPPAGCRSASSTLLPHPCREMGSLVFFVFLPIRLNLITCNGKQRSPLSPPLCGNGDLEIVSVKELADGFLHFSFGVPSNVTTSSKVNELSSSHCDHLAGKVSVSHRLPSKFSKRSPIPVAGVQRNRRQGENPAKQGSADSTSASVKEPVASSLRPKSCFVKRSPILPRRGMKSLQNEFVSDETEVQSISKRMPQRIQIESHKEGISKRPPSKFVRKSPISLTSINHLESSLPSANPSLLSDESGDTAVRSHQNPVAAGISRPKSVFSRRSPIVRAHISTNKTLQQGHNSSTNVDNASGISSASSENLSQNNIDLQKCKLAELKNLAKSKGLKGYSKLKKGDLLNLLLNVDS